MSSGMCRSLTMQNTTNNNNGPSTKTFEFDRVFGEEAKTAEVYEELTPPRKGGGRRLESDGPSLWSDG